MRLRSNCHSINIRERNILSDRPATRSLNLEASAVMYRVRLCFWQSILLSLLFLIRLVRPVQAEPAVFWEKDPFPKRLFAEIVPVSQFVQSEAAASCTLSFADAGDPEPFAEAVYVLAAAYPVNQEGLSLRLLKLLWQGQPTSSVNQLVMEAETYRVFNGLWGQPDRSTVSIHPAADLLALAWDNPSTGAILPFNKLEPRWKVLSVNGQNPYKVGFLSENYPLTVRWHLADGSDGRCKMDAALKNYDTSRLTTLTLTGTTALVRRLAYAIEEKGTDHPVEEIAPILSGSDITHVSNEASFFDGCPPGIPLRRESRFCSLPSYLGLLEKIGADVIELTGNHNLDWGAEAYLSSLELFEQYGFHTYGGGANTAAAEEPLFIEHNGNRIALLGCNAVGPETALAQGNSPGAARCNLEKLKKTVTRLQQEGWLCVITFQHFEYDDYTVPPVESHDFLALAELGPAVISGSQAHIPQGFTFVDDTFIHFGLGNLLFDQTSPVERDSFFDRHFFYEGRYIGNYLETIRLEESMQVRFLNALERNTLMNTILSTCSWNRVFQ